MVQTSACYQASAVARRLQRLVRRGVSSTPGVPSTRQRRFSLHRWRTVLVVAAQVALWISCTRPSGASLHGPGPDFPGRLHVPAVLGGEFEPIAVRVMKID